jgi:molecular chaperone GrpE
MRKIRIIEAMNDEELKDTTHIEPEENVDEDVVEFVYNEDGEEDLKATLKKLRKDVKEALKEKQEYLTNWQKERADFLNFKKDEAERAKVVNSVARESFAESLLPVLDAYDMAFSNKEAWEKVDKNWRMGVEYIHQQLLKVLAENGIEEIPSKEGDTFDPNVHQSVEIVPTQEDSQENTVSKILQKGYKNGSRIVRPARVNVWGN